MEKGTQLSVFLRNIPGELGRFAALMADEDINILAMFIQNASLYLKEMFEARGKAISRSGSAASYGSVLKEAQKYSLIRVLVDDTDRAVKVLGKAQYWVDSSDVLVLKLKNKPGTLADISTKFGNAGINIDYVYGSGAENAKTAIYVFHVPDVTRAIDALSG
jgi:hypothetical protein